MNDHDVYITSRVPFTGVNLCSIGEREASTGEAKNGTVTAVSRRIKSFVWQIAAARLALSSSDLTFSGVRVLEAERTVACTMTRSINNTNRTRGGGDEDENIVSHFSTARAPPSSYREEVRASSSECSERK